MTSEAVHAGPTWEADDPTWREQAACRGIDPELFHPRRGQDTRAAKAVCAQCPVVDICLQWALENNEMMGVWGGTSERERRLIRRQRRLDAGESTVGKPKKPVNHGTYNGYAQHRYRKEPPCDLCRLAYNAYKAPRVAAWKATQRGDAA